MSFGTGWYEGVFGVEGVRAVEVERGLATRGVFIRFADLGREGMGVLECPCTAAWPVVLSGPSRQDPPSEPPYKSVSCLGSVSMWLANRLADRSELSGHQSRRTVARAVMRFGGGAEAVGLRK